MTKRIHGEGSIYERQDGRWVAELTVAGRKTRKYIYAKSAEEALRKLTEARSLLQEGRLPMGKRIKVAPLTETVIEEVIKPSAKHRTYLAYQGAGRHLVAEIGHHWVDEVRAMHLERAYGRLLRELSANHVRLIHTVGRIVFGKAVAWDLIARNPAERVSAPRRPKTRVQVLTAAQVELLLAASEGDHWGFLWTVIVVLGLRLGEALGLTWDNVDMARRRVAIRQTLQWQKERGLILVPPKTESSHREIEFGEAAHTAFVRQRQWQDDARKQAGASWQEHGLVFCRPNGLPLYAARCNKAFLKATSAAGLLPMRIHDLRHSAATLLLENRVNPKLVQEMLGHSSMAETLGTYGHILEGNARAAALLMDGILGGASRREQEQRDG